MFVGGLNKVKTSSDGMCGFEVGYKVFLSASNLALKTPSARKLLL